MSAEPTYHYSLRETKTTTKHTWCVFEKLDSWTSSAPFIASYPTTATAVPATAVTTANAALLQTCAFRILLHIVQLAVTNHVIKNESKLDLSFYVPIHKAHPD